MNKIAERLVSIDKQYLWHPFTQMKVWVESEPALGLRKYPFHLLVA